MPHRALSLVRHALPAPILTGLRLVRRRLQRIFRRFRPPDRSAALRQEVDFWRDYLLTGGARWPQDFRDRLDPRHPVQDHVGRVLDQLDGDALRILDVGAGPLTKLGKTHPSKSFTITPVDLLAPEYDRLLAELGIVPPVRTVQGEAESLRARFGDDAFDVVHAVNALDHTEQPLRALGEMLAVVRPGGAVILDHHENEGDRQDFNQLHQWNFTCADGDFVIGDRRGRATNVTRALGPGAATTCARQPEAARTAGILVVIRKRR